MIDTGYYPFGDATARAQKAMQACLYGNVLLAQEILLQLRNELKRQSGDLPIVSHEREPADITSKERAFLTQSFAETQAWGWLELASGIVQLVLERPGTGMMYFSRAWRIWRLPSLSRAGLEGVEQQEAVRERIRARLWLGEAWARSMSDRAERSAKAILRAALAELERLNAHDILYETIAQQALLPPAALGSPAHRDDRQVSPYVCTMQDIA
ncbi:MAG TPA: hypothetical protein VKU38_17740 [Ktedonobacteraceae bacterium]|nr:hypothetical protein [Ktedonobacteraceae bacterium]